jgi:hypothetical protein
VFTVLLKNLKTTIQGTDTKIENKGQSTFLAELQASSMKTVGTAEEICTKLQAQAGSFYKAVQKQEV